MRIPVLAAGVALLSSMSAKADYFPITFLTDHDLGGIQSDVVWNNLSNQNPGRTPILGTGTIAPVSPGMQLSNGFYSFSAPFSFDLSKSGFTSDVQTIVLQVQWDPDEFVTVIPPTLGFNGGSLTLEPSWGGQTLLETTATIATGAEIPNFIVQTWQWDLSSVVENIESIQINAPFYTHSNILAVSLETSTAVHAEPVFTAVPEPSTGILAGLGVAALGLCRRRQRAA